MAEKRDVVRQHIDLRETKRRRLVDRVYMRFPRLVQAVTRSILRRPPTSLIRRRMIRHEFRRLLEAGNRGDHEASLTSVPSDYESITPPELVSLGFEPTYHGQEGRLRFQLTWIGELGEFQQDQAVVFDTGDQLLLLVRMKGSGLGSGAEFESEIAYLITVSSRGELLRERSFRSHAEGLEAAGLQDQLTSPGRAP
jgi:hypothetical protein